MAENGAIVVGFDGSDCAQAALDTAIDLAKAYGDKVVVVFGAAPPGVATEEFREHRRAIEELGEKVTGDAVARASAGGVGVEVVVAPQRPYEALITTASERSARFIVVGSYGESPLKGAFLGSVPHKLVHLSETPVVVVRA